MKIRAATQKDVAPIANLFVLARTAAMPWLPVLHTHEEDLRFFSRTILPKQTVEVAQQAGDVAGFIAYDDSWVNQLYIHPDFWRQGLGSALLNRALQTAAYRQLWVFEQNRAAQKFYARHGFEVVEQTDGANNEERCPDLRMEWRSA